MRSIEIPQPNERDWRYRAFEILPGALTWLILTAPFTLSLIDAKLAAYFIIVYLLTWLVRAIVLNIRTLQGWRTIKQHQNLPWGSLNKDLELLEPKTKNAPRWHAENIARVHQYMQHSRMMPSEIIQAVIIAAHNESRDIIEPTIQSLVSVNYDPKKIILFLAYEERGGDAIEQTATDLIKEYGHHFYFAQAVKHPDGIPGEVKGKGGNITNAGRQLLKYIRSAKIDPAKVLVTTLDADNRPDKQYFGALTYTFCSTEEPKYVSYQPIPMFLNNIWDAPAPMRVVATGNSFWQIIQSVRPHLLRNFSAHSQSLETLIDTDFWSVRTVVEDGHQFWRTYFRYDGHHDVYPVYIPIYQDAVLASSYLKSLRAQFKQMQRWAYGASDVAYVAYNGFLKRNKIPKYKVVAKFLRLLEGHIGWSTMPLILSGAALVPFLLNPQSYLANQLPQIASHIQRVAIVGGIITLYLSLISLPPKPARYKHHRTIFMVLQWAYMPLTMIIYTACSGINAQTRLMFKWYLGRFDATEKAVKH